MPDYGFRYGLHVFATPGTMQDENEVFRSMRKRADPSFAKKVVYPNADKLYEWWKNLCENTELYYYLEVMNGTYDINLYFSELEGAKPGQRVFNVEIEEQPVLKGVDIAQEVGENIGIVKTIKGVVVKDNYINIDFVGEVGKPCVSAIEIIPTF